MPLSWAADTEMQTEIFAMKTMDQIARFFNEISRKPPVISVIDQVNALETVPKMTGRYLSRSFYTSARNHTKE
jgi:hypothetical protein